MLAEGIDPLLHIVEGRRAHEHGVLDNAALAEGEAECVRFFRFGLRDLLQNEIVQWFEVLWLQIVLFLHFINLEVYQSCIG